MILFLDFDGVLHPEPALIREISRRTGLARNTVKKHLRSEVTEPNYERRVSSSKLDPYAEKLATWLGIEATKIAETAAQFEADPHSLSLAELTP